MGGHPGIKSIGAPFSDSDSDGERGLMRDHRDNYMAGGRFTDEEEEEEEEEDRLEPIGEGFSDDEMDPEEVEDEEEVVALVPIAYHPDPSRLTFKKVTTLKQLSDSLKAKSNGLRISCGELYKNNKEAQKLFASGANLGDMYIDNLVAHNCPVGLTVRVESEANPKAGYNAINVKPATVFSPDVDRAQHAILLKENQKPMQFLVRKGNDMEEQTFLSYYPDYTASTLNKNIKPALKRGIDEIDTQHPVVHYLDAKDYFPEGHLANMETVHVDTKTRKAVQQTLREQESSVPKVGDAQSVSLVIGMAYGVSEGGGAPSFSDTTELCDDLTSRGAMRTKMINMRRNAPIKITGEFVIQHGYPTPAHGDDDDLDDVYEDDEPTTISPVGGEYDEDY
jgi:hypothetical protein